MKKEKVEYPNTLAFWKHGERIISQRILKKDIPAYSRLMLVKNKFKDNDIKPDYVAYFVEIKGGYEAAENISRPYTALRTQVEEDIINEISEMSLDDIILYLLDNYSSYEIEERLYTWTH